MTNNKHALLIGINNYHLLSDLKYARHDAEAFSEALQEYCGFSAEDITLMSCDASGACQAQSLYIDRALSSLSGYRNLDLLVFGFWGHGFAPEAGKRYLCGTNTLEDDLERSAVSLDVVKAKLSQVGAENTLMILDCCQNRPGGRGGTSETLSRGEEQSFASMARDIQAASVGKHSKYTVPTVAILNACREGQKAYEWDKKQHGIFTAHLLNTLSSGCTSVSRLAHSVFGPVAKTADELYRQKQTPYVVIEGQGDILLVSSGYSDEKSISAKSRPPRKTKSPSIIWWLDEDKQIPESELIALIKNGELTGSTEVWRAGLDDWVELKEVPELSQHISSSPPSRSKKPSALTHKNGDIMTVPELGMELVYVEPGRFMMGSDDEVSCGDEQPVHEVTITRGYWLGKYPVTQEEYKQIMGVNPSYFKGGNHPVEKVSWNDAVKFCKKLTEREQAAGRLPSGYEYRLPTEAEWEFAARGGTGSMGYVYSGSDCFDSVAWYAGSSKFATQEVGRKAPNELGVYDMCGNVWEWCLDNCSYNSGIKTDTYREGVVDPLCKTGLDRVIRGGCWGGGVGDCRIAKRGLSSPWNSDFYLGFRVALACELFVEHYDGIEDEFIVYQTDAHAGDNIAQCNLGDCYLHGKGVTQNQTEAVKWYRMAAEQGHVWAQCNLGDCYQYGRGVDEDKAEAVKWYRKAAEQGLDWAQCNLGDCYFHGYGVDEDKAEAVKWYRLAADQGHGWGQCNLGDCYLHGKGVTQNQTEAVKWYRMAAEQGHVWAQCNLGDCYQYGRGVDEDKAEAVKWYRKAAEQGLDWAQCNLGDCYFHGYGVDEDKAEAVKWYRLAADQGHGWGQCSLGDCYQYGRGVDVDKAEAVKWYRLAADQGNLSAKNSLNELGIKD